MRSREKSNKRNSNGGAKRPSLKKRHEAHCRICRDARRAEIDGRFLDWESPRKIAEVYGLSKTSVYRHVEATGLADRRRKNPRLALNRMVNRVNAARVTARAVVEAIRLSAKLSGVL